MRKRERERVCVSGAKGGKLASDSGGTIMVAHCFSCSLANSLGKMLLPSLNLWMESVAVRVN